MLQNSQCLHFFVSFLPDIFGDFCHFFSNGSFVKVIICTCLLLGAVERKFPSASFPNARRDAKKAANKAGLNAKQRLESTGKYSEDAKGKKKQSYLALMDAKRKKDAN